MQRGDLDLLLVWDSDPAHSMPGFREAMEKVPMVICLAPLPGDTSLLADWALPETLDGEGWSDGVTSRCGGRASAVLQAPAVEPAVEAMGGIDFLLALAREAGGRLSEILPWSDAEAVLRQGWRGLHAAARGSVQASDFESFWTSAAEAGGWHAGPEAPGPTGTVRLDAPRVREPAFQGEAGRYPLLLLPYPTTAFLDGRTAPLPGLQELPDPMTGETWGSWAEVGPAEASALGLADGDAVVVETPRGSAAIRLRVNPGLAPGTLCIPAGQGHAGGGRWAAGRGCNPFDLLEPVTEPRTGALCHGGTRARLRRA